MLSQIRSVIRILSTLILLLGVAHTAEASVRINEVAWMGTAESSSNEWIELYNDATGPVDLTNWHLGGDGGSPNITLAGTIAPQGYYLIERTDDTTVPDIKADLVASFGKGLSNNGETLVLTDAQSAIVDTVVGGANWVNIGGDNTTKQTAQRLQGGGWATGVPTPRAANITASAPTKPTPTKMSGTLAPATSVTQSAKVALPKNILPVSQQKIANKSGTTSVLWKRSIAGVGATGFFNDPNNMWLFILAGIALTVFAGLVIAKNNKEELAEADQYAIIEDIIEGVDD